MRLVEVWRKAACRLASAGFEQYELESEVLFRHVLQISRGEFYSRFNEEVHPDKQAAFCKLVDKRLTKYPVAYITQAKSFYNTELYVKEGVLIPRPETELLVEECLDIIKDKHNPLICDLGTGSGAIAIAVGVNCPSAKIYAIDISRAALKVAETNRHRYNLENQILLIEGDMLQNCPEPVDVIAANLPYVKSADALKNSFEPQEALDGGTDGLALIEKLLMEFGYCLKPGGCLLIEIGYHQNTRVQEMVSSCCPGYRIYTKKDLSGIPRLAVIKRI